MKPRTVSILLAVTTLCVVAVVVGSRNETVRELNVANGATRERVIAFGFTQRTTPTHAPRWITNEPDDWVYMGSTGAGGSPRSHGPYGYLGASFSSIDYFIEELEIPEDAAREMYHRVRDRFIEIGRWSITLEVNDWDIGTVSMMWNDENDQEQTEIIFERQPMDG